MVYPNLSSYVPYEGLVSNFYSVEKNYVTSVSQTTTILVLWLLELDADIVFQGHQRLHIHEKVEQRQRQVPVGKWRLYECYS